MSSPASFAGAEGSRSLAGNLPRLYAFRFLRDFLLIMPAIVPVYRESGLRATEILLVQAVFSAALLLFEVPAGYAADVLGRKRALALGAACMALAMAGYGFASGFWHFAAAEVALALAFSLCSGTESALLFDTLKGLGREAEYQAYEGRSEALTRLGTGVAAAAGGLLAGVALRLPFAGNAATAAAMLLVALLLVEPPRRALAGKAPLREILRITGESLRDPRLLPPMLLWAGVFASGVIGIWGYFLRLTGAGVTVLSYGIYFAVFQGASAAAAAGSDRLARRLGPRLSFAPLAIIPAVLVLLALTDSPWPVLLTPLAAAAWGFATPLLLEQLNRHVESDRRATVLSVASMLGRVVFVVVAPLFGYLVDSASDRAASACLAWAFAAFAVAAGVLQGRVRAAAR